MYSFVYCHKSMLQELNSYNTDCKIHMPKIQADPTESLLTPVVKMSILYKQKGLIQCHSNSQQVR